MLVIYQVQPDALYYAQTGPPGHSAVITLTTTLKPPQPAAVDESFSPSAPTLAHDESWTPQYTASPWRPSPFTYDEFGEQPLANFPLQHDEPWVAQYQVIPWRPDPSTYDEFGEQPLANFYLDDFAVPVATPGPSQWSIYAPAAEEIFAPQATAAIEEVHAVDVPVWRVTWVVFQPAADDGLYWAQTGPPGHSAVITLTTQLAPRVGFSADDPLGFTAVAFGLDQDNAQPLTPTAYSWTSIVFASDEESEPVIDEIDLWVPRVQAIPWRQANFSDDETGPQLKNFYLEQLEPLVAQYTTILWVARPATDDEIRVTPPASAIEDDLPLVVLRQIIPWSPSPFTDDEIGSQLKNFYLDHTEPVSAATTKVVWVALPFADDDVRPTRIVDDEGDVKPPVMSLPWAAKPQLDNPEIGTVVIFDEHDWWTPRRVGYITQRPYPFFDEIASFLGLVPGQVCLTGQYVDVLDVTGVYETPLQLSAEYANTFDVAGSYVRTLYLTGQYVFTIDVTALYPEC